MTTQKVQSKIKSSTIAITVLSILLAVAVASTIVLAAFSATRQASTTISFGGGLTMTLSSAANDDFNQLAATTDQTVTITPKETTFSKDGVTMSALKAQTNEAAYVGFKIIVANGSGTTGNWTYSNNLFTNETAKLKVAVNLPEANAATAVADGVYFFATATTKDVDVTIFDSVVISSTTNDVNDIASKSVSITIQFKAETVAGGGNVDNVKNFAGFSA